MDASKQIVHDRLRALARNLWWSWQFEVTNIFRELDPKRWSALGHNPLALLHDFSPDALEQRVDELALHGRINYAFRRLQEYVGSDDTWAATHAGVLRARPVAYFSAEFGIHHALPIYSGGLGVLAGDHLKSASDLGVPMVGIGLFYDQGYFTQQVDATGWQREDYLKVDVDKLPVEVATTRAGQPVTIAIEMRGTTLHARVWKVRVGRNLLLLLDSDVDGNTDEDRKLTSRLYWGDARIRIRQEMMLGVGGVRALSALGVRPGVLHLNEGHSAFAVLELIRERMQTEGAEFEEAAREVAAQTVFTTHTPVPAGHDRFAADLVEEHIGPLRTALGLDEEDLTGLGRVTANDSKESFCMTVLALKLSHHANAVSALHGRVSRRMWQPLWPGHTEEEVPIGHITNGVHVASWLAPHMMRLYDRYFEPGWSQRTAFPEMWAGIESVEASELWETHQALKSELLEFARRRASRQAQRRGDPAQNVETLRHAMRLDGLLIGFARRFATYKRATMLFHDLDRLDRLVNDPDRPIQIVFAGKAHPRDDGGKQLIQNIMHIARDPRFIGKILFIEDYDINVGRHLVQGVDVWLNNPRRPLEASGTSGQKVLLNGGLNCSILDGWWAEAFDGTNGFAIGTGDVHRDSDVQDQRDGLALYDVLEQEVLPLYYERDHDGLPRGWIDRMKRSIRTLGWRYNADRMVMDYVREAYLPAAGGMSCLMRRA